MAGKQASQQHTHAGTDACMYVCTYLYNSDRYQSLIVNNCKKLLTTGGAISWTCTKFVQINNNNKNNHLSILLSLFIVDLQI